MSAVYAWLIRHPMLVDGVLAFCLAVTGLGSGLRADLSVQLPLVAAMTVPVVFRRSTRSRRS